MKRWLNLMLNSCYIIALLGISFLITYFLYSPIHEANHSLICLINGLEPIQERFASECRGIEKASYLAQFFFFMMPYVFSIILLLIIKFAYKKLRFAKFLIFIPVTDILVNYFSSMTRSDFSMLLVNTNIFLFALGIAIVVVTIELTLHLAKKTQVLSFKRIAG